MSLIPRRVLASVGVDSPERHEAWRSIRGRAAELDRQLVAMARRSDECQVLKTIPGVGAVTSTSFVAAIEDPKNFRISRSVGAWLGLTTRRYQSGEVDYDGHISRRGDSHLRGLRAATMPLFFGPTVPCWLRPSSLRRARRSALNRHVQPL